MTNTERAQLEARLAEIDRRRATLEMVISTLPPTPHHCEDCEDQREQLEAELRGLRSLRAELVGAQFITT